jgi:Flp pilus assembly protein protease CpaA
MMHLCLVGLHIFRVFIISNWLDFILCAISIAVAVLYHPITILSRLWPYISLLITFGAFVLWNGGVVLGMSHLSQYNPHIRPF